MAIMLRWKQPSRHAVFRLGWILVTLPSAGGGWAFHMGNVGLMEITNHVDAVLVQLLGALWVRHNNQYVPDELEKRPFNHILGTLCRNALASAIKEDGLNIDRSVLYDKLKLGVLGVLVVQILNSRPNCWCRGKGKNVA